jgi:hypothetical protein
MNRPSAPRGPESEIEETGIWLTGKRIDRAVVANARWLRSSAYFTDTRTANSPPLPGPQKPLDVFPLSGSLRTILPMNRLELRIYGAGRVWAAIMASYF